MEGNRLIYIFLWVIYVGFSLYSILSEVIPTIYSEIYKKKWYLKVQEKQHLVQ